MLLRFTYSKTGRLSPKFLGNLFAKQSSTSKENLVTSFPDDALTQKVNDTVVYSGYRNVVSRRVKLPNDNEATFDVVIQKHLSVVVFVWDSSSATGTLVREYHPGPDRFLYGTVAGMCEAGKHNHAMEAARFELEEEAQLRSDNWFPLLAQESIKMPFDKYSNNHFLPFMALDCHRVCNPRPLDDEEFITIHHNITYDQMMGLILKGEMNVVSTYTILLGFQKLQELGISFKK